MNMVPKVNPKAVKTSIVHHGWALKMVVGLANSIWALCEVPKLSLTCLFRTACTCVMAETFLIDVRFCRCDSATAQIRVSFIMVSPLNHLCVWFRSCFRHVCLEQRVYARLTIPL